jgi:hypothetical protein
MGYHCGFKKKETGRQEAVAWVVCTGQKTPTRIPSHYNCRFIVVPRAQVMGKPTQCSGCVFFGWVGGGCMWARMWVPMFGGVEVWVMGYDGMHN